MPSVNGPYRNQSEYQSSIELRYEDMHENTWTLTGFGSGEQAYWIAVDGLRRGLFTRVIIMSDAKHCLYSQLQLDDAAGRRSA